MFLLKLVGISISHFNWILFCLKSFRSSIERRSLTSVLLLVLKPIVLVFSMTVWRTNTSQNESGDSQSPWWILFILILLVVIMPVGVWRCVVVFLVLIKALLLSLMPLAASNEVCSRMLSYILSNTSLMISWACCFLRLEFWTKPDYLCIQLTFHSTPSVQVA